MPTCINEILRSDDNFDFFLRHWLFDLRICTVGRYINYLRIRRLRHEIKDRGTEMGLEMQLLELGTYLKVRYLLMLILPVNGHT